MKKQDNHSVSTSTLKIALALALVSLSAIGLTSTSIAAPVIIQPNQSCGRIDNPDSVAVNRHFQGLASLTGCPLTAADANANSFVNNQDVLAIQRYYLGFTSGIGSTGTDAGCGLCRGDVSSGTNSPLPGITLSLPTANLDTSINISTVINLPVVTTNIDPSLDLIAFQANLTFDERVITFSTPGNPLIGAGLTDPTWTTGGNILPGAGPFRTLRISCFANDVRTPLTGSGTLFNLKVLRVSSTPGDISNLVWFSSPDDFQFVQTTLNKFSPTQNNGLITITGPTPTPAPTASPSCRIDTPDQIAAQRVLLNVTPLTGCPAVAADCAGGAGINTQDQQAMMRFYLGFTTGTGSAGTDTGCGRCFGDPITSTNSTIPGITVTLPTTTLNTGIDPSTTIIQPVATTNIDSSAGLVGFQGDFIFDERVVTFPTVAAQRAGLTLALPWNVNAHVLPGTGPFRTLRVTAFSLDTTTGLSGSGTLFELKMLRVSGTVGDASTLVWIASPNDFEFVDENLNLVSPQQINGQVTIVSEPTPTPAATPTPPPTPAPTASPTPQQFPTLTPAPTATVPPGVPTVSAPTFVMSTADGFAINDQPVTTTFVDPSLNIIGFQGDIIFDSAIAAPSPGMNPLVAAGLTASGWDVSGNVLNTGPGTMKTVRVSAISSDGLTPLSGTGTLYLIHWKRVSTNPGDTTPLTWPSAFPNRFFFVDNNLSEFSPPQIDGAIAITSSATPTPSGTMVTISGRIGNCASPSPTVTPPAAPTPPPLPAVPNVVMTLSGSSSATTLTDAAGNYSFTVPAGGSYIVTPGKGPAAPASPGFDIRDVLAIQRHYLGILAIPAGCRLSAADPLPDSVINTWDGIAIQKFWQGHTIGIASCGQYKFSPANHSYPSITMNQTAQDYAMYVLGDTAGSFANRPDGPSPDAIEENELTYSGVASVNLPQISANLSRRSFSVPVTSSLIDEEENLVGFQGDFTFDERVVTFSTEAAQASGLTANNWSVSGTVLPGEGPIRTLRISGYSTDFVPLSGSGTLFALRIRTISDSAFRVPHSGFSLMWAAPPNEFIFINSDLQSQRPGSTLPGSVSPTQQW